MAGRAGPGGCHVDLALLRLGVVDQHFLSLRRHRRVGDQHGALARVHGDVLEVLHRVVAEVLRMCAVTVSSEIDLVMIVYPSGFALFPISRPSAPPAPALSSTTICWPSASL